MIPINWEWKGNFNKLYWLYQPCNTQIYCHS